MDAASGVLVTGIEGTSLTPAELAFFESEQVAGVTLFKWNMTGSFAELRQLVGTFSRTRRTGRNPYIVAIDQEGGRVARLKQPFPDFGPAQKLLDGRTDPEALQWISSYGFSVGAALRGFGINVDFAPVADILTNPSNTAIGDRVFGVTPEQVAARAGAFMDGLQAAGVAGSLKHFPGQGDAAVDTHAGAAVVRGSIEELNRRELVPFRELMGRCPMVMMAHVIYPDVCPNRASGSSKWITEILRGDMGYQGVIVSDDMNMGAVNQDSQSWKEALVESIVAGVDMLLVCRYLERFRIALEGLRAEAARSTAFAVRLEQAARRVATVTQAAL